MENFNWLQYGVILAGAVFGIIAVTPYAFQINKDKLAEAPMPLPKLALLSLIQGMVIFAIVTFFGLNASTALGLAITSPMESIPLAIIAGVTGTTVMVLIEARLFQPHLPTALKDAQHAIPVWKRFLAGFYGGISEEVLTRLFLVSGITWLIVQITQSQVDSVIPLAIILSALIFGIGHLPATAAITPLTPLLIVRAIVLNGIIGIVCGLLFWQYGLVSAMVAHFCADMVLHVIAPPFLNKHNEEHQIASMQPV